jgi:hypothetical protein
MSLGENVAEILPQPRGGNYEVARFNALRHGVLSKHAVLPWEDPEEYSRLLEALVAEHKPQGPTEEHFVEELGCRKDPQGCEPRRSADRTADQIRAGDKSELREGARPHRAADPTGAG